MRLPGDSECQEQQANGNGGNATELRQNRVFSFRRDLRKRVNHTPNIANAVGQAYIADQPTKPYANSAATLQEVRIKMKMAMCLVLLGLLPVSPIYAHHGSHVSYDMEKPRVLKGTVTEFVWSNPHSQIYFDVKDEKGDAVNWGAETANPSALAKSGWTRNSLKPGDEITVTVWPSKAHTPRGFLLKIEFPNGEVKTLAGAALE